MRIDIESNRIVTNHPIYTPIDFAGVCVCVSVCVCLDGYFNCFESNYITLKKSVELT